MWGGSKGRDTFSLHKTSSSGAQRVKHQDDSALRHNPHHAAGDPRQSAVAPSRPCQAATSRVVTGAAGRVGAFFAARPMFQRSVDGKRHFYIVNAAIAALLSVAFVVLVLALGDEVYRCDVLGRPNCD